MEWSTSAQQVQESLKMLQGASTLSYIRMCIVCDDVHNSFKTRKSYQDQKNRIKSCKFIETSVLILFST